MDKTKLKFGLLKSKSDSHEKLLSFTYEKVYIPRFFTLKDRVKYIFNQGHSNSCSANAVTNQLLLSDKKQLINDVPSRLFIYVNSRLRDNGIVCPLSDCGASFKSVFEALLMYKFPTENEYKFDINQINKIPPIDVYRSSFKTLNPIFSYRRILPCIYSFKYILYVLKLPRYI